MLINSWGKLNEHLEKASILKKIPLSGEFELTARCNLHCKMCYLVRESNDQEAIQEELSASEWLRIAKEARDAGMLYVLLTGGEPLLHPEFRTIYEGFSELGFVITLYTNGTMITPEFVQWLAKRPPYLVSISMYGASAETYEDITTVAAGYERVVRGIELLRAKRIRMELKTTLLKDNIMDFESLFAFAFERDIKFGMVNYIFPRREGDSTSPVQFRLDPEALVDFQDYATNYIQNRLESKHGKALVDDLNLFDTDSDRSQTHLIKNQDCLDCYAGTNAIWFTWNGDIIPCGMMNEPRISVKEVSFKKAFTDLQEAIKLISRSEECESCAFKDECMTCPARLLSETGDYTKKAEYLCDQIKYGNARNESKLDVY